MNSDPVDPVEHKFNSRLAGNGVLSSNRGRAVLTGARVSQGCRVAAQAVLADRTPRVLEDHDNPGSTTEAWAQRNVNAAREHWPKGGKSLARRTAQEICLCLSGEHCCSRAPSSNDEASGTGKRPRGNKQSPQPGNLEKV
eukprot:EG_transcript_8988